MAKRIVLIRHAKSSWANPLQSDFERPLNDRGQHDAPMMGERLKKAGIIPDRVIASTAKRAKQTAKHIAKGVGYDPEKINWHEELYHCVPAVFEEVIAAADDAEETLFIVAHNPGISAFAAELDPSKTIHHMPTCAVVGIELDITRWSDLPFAGKKLFLYDTPKKDHE
jgi:phosphohistidine phosphatase